MPTDAPLPEAINRPTTCTTLWQPSDGQGVGWDPPLRTFLQMASSWFENFRAEVTSADEQVKLEARAAMQRVVTIPILQVMPTSSGFFHWVQAKIWVGPGGCIFGASQI